MKYLIYSSLLLISFLIGSCAPRLIQPDLSLQQIELTGVSFSAIDLTFKIKLTNPNFAGINVDQLSYQMNLNDIRLGSGELQNPVFLKAADSQIIVLPFSVSYLGISKVFRLLLGENEVTYKLEGKVTVSKFFKKQVFPFSSTGVVPINRSSFHHPS